MTDRAAGKRLHPRTLLVEKAEADLRAHVGEMASALGLTWTEAAMILGRAQLAALRHALREERHPDDPDRKADEE